MSISYWLDQSAQKDALHYDYVIIGGGIAGLSTAYWLQKKDANLKIAILEKHGVGYGASGRNAGFVTAGSTEHFIKLNAQFGTAKATEIWQFSETNRKLLLEHIIEDAADEVDFRHTGSCTVAPSEEHWEKYKATAKLMQSQGIDVHEVTPEEMHKDYGVTGFVGGIQYTGDGYIHPIKLLQRLRRKLHSEIYENHEVFAIEEKSGRNFIRTNHETFSANKVIVTVNAYLPLVLEEFSSYVKPGRGQILLTQPLPAFVKGPCYLTKHLCYFRQLPTGELLIGGFRNLAIQEEETYADNTTEVIQRALLDFVRSHFTLGKEARVAYQWSGLMGYTPDMQMILGEVPKRKNTYVIAGCSGHGMGLSFNAAKTLVESIHGGTLPSNLDIARFKF